VSFPIKISGFQSISLETTYERRMLMKREVSFMQLPDKTLKAVSFGRTPRDWVDTKLIFKFSDLFGAFIGYQYGQQPPLYKLVDHGLKLGLTFRAKLKSE